MHLEQGVGVFLIIDPNHYESNISEPLSSHILDIVEGTKMFRTVGIVVFVLMDMYK